MTSQATVTNVGAEADDVVFGLSATIAAAVAYLLPFGIIFLLTEDDNEFVRYNAAQSVAYTLGLYLFRFALNFVFGMMPGFVSLLVAPFMMVFNLAIFVGLVFMAYKAFSGDLFEAPVFADMAHSLEESI
ncbi:DUF4870 domain-containing protein [Haloarcula sp. JP-Z28]|uniref:DUF4870 domain-containing protein n=1 Tax=Haloarcula sp. JP-Z28 TaxID=2716715 RepID=UPI0014047336|nr:DUF4870 domain-containing protein [Haloarcula sp. JP-Z28]NHN65349.1 DUF4870 domain-containing protein [Haloarcula sp. JP-Z28]